MRKLFAFALAAMVTAALHALPAVAAQKIIIVGDSDYPPYCFDNNGENDGIYVQMLRKIFSRMDGYDVEIKLMPWRRALSQVKNGTAFGIFPPYYRPGKRPWIHPYSEPLLKEKMAVFCNKRVLGNERTEFPEDYFGLAFGVNLGFALGGEDFCNAVAAGKIRLEEVKGTEKNLQKLVMGRVDCYIGDKYAALWSLKRLVAEGRLRGRSDDVVESRILGGASSYLGFSAKADTADFVAAFNALLKKMKAGGEVDAIVRQFSR